MRLRTGHDGRQLPFERQRRLVLRRLPVGAVVTRAVLVVSPYSVDENRRFLETITFPDSVGDWGANRHATTGAVEVDLHTRRKLASLVGTNLVGGTLLVDLGGGFLVVNNVGGLGEGPPITVANTMDLPGLIVTGLRVANTGADVSVLRVASPPSNLSVGFEGGPVFFVHLGDLVEPVTTPDFAAVLQAMLPDLDVELGHHLVPLVVHSDTIARLDLELEVDFTVAVSGTPPGLASIQAPYRYDGTPASADGRLSVAVPPGMVAVPGGTAGRVQGAFESTRVVFGPLESTRVVFGPLSGAAVAEEVLLAASGPLAQPFVLPATEVATSVDLLLTAVTAEVALAVDLVEDLDGKPGRTSILPSLAELTLTRDQAGAPTWVNVALPAEVELAGGARRWLVLQAREGTASWGAGPAVAPSAPAGDPGLQQTRDGGLSWRMVAGGQVPGPLAAQLRLRHVTTTFHMPLELRVGAGDSEVGVSLQRFAPQGAVDLDLSFPAVAEAFNTALAASGQPPSVTGEHVANGDFADWYRVGVAVDGPVLLQPTATGGRSLNTAAFEPDGGTVYFAGQGDNGMRFLSFDVFCRDQLLDTGIGSGTPVAMVVDGAGRSALVAAVDFGVTGATGFRSELSLVDTATGRPVGLVVLAAEPVLGLAVSPDGLGVYLLGLEQPSAGLSRASVRRVPWSALRAAAGGSELDWDDHPSDSLAGAPRALAVGPDGRVFVLTESDGSFDLHAYQDGASFEAGVPSEEPTAANAVDLAVVPPGDEVLVLGAAEVWVVRTSDLHTLRRIPLPAGTNAQCMEVDPTGELAVIVQEGDVLVLDVGRRVLLPASGVTISDSSDGAGMAMSPAGTHVVVTRVGAFNAAVLTIGDALPVDWELTAGQVQPFCLPATGEILALIGQVTMARAGGAVVPAAIAQVVPVAGGTRYRFAFDGLAQFEGTLGEVIWRGDDCAPSRTDQVPVAVLDPTVKTALAQVPPHELTVTSPPGVTQAEVRFFTPEGAMIVDRVSLAGSSNAVSQTWQPSAPSITSTPSGSGFTLANGGSTSSTVHQVLASPAGHLFELLVAARVAAGAEGAAVELAFSDEASVAVGEVVRVDIDPLEFEERAASGQVPAGAAEVELRIVVPPGGSVEVTRLSLSIGAAAGVGMHFVSEAPGELTMSGVVVQLDLAEPSAAPLPDAGLCPATPPGGGPGGEDCYCGPCGRDRPVRRAAAVVTDSGRPGSVATCPVCGSARVRVGGRPVAHAEPVALPRYRVLDRAVGPGRRGPAIVARLRVDVALAEISGIGEKRALGLSRLGIPDVMALSEAAVATVASLRGVSDRMARKFIAEAARLVRERGERVIFDG